jgi:phosphate butyryltransferase
VKSFKELIDTARKSGKRQCVVACAHDDAVLEGIRMAQQLDLIHPILIGKRAMIIERAAAVKLDLKNAEVIDSPDDDKALENALTTVREKGDFIMKGMLSTSMFLKGILHKTYGLRKGTILSHIAVLEIPGYHKLIYMSDGGMNPKLNLKIRSDIIQNGIDTMHAVGIREPKIAIVAASETVNPDMPETTDAVQIVEKHKNGEYPGCMIDGPFGFDVAISQKAAAHKKLQTPLAGDTDFLLMPNISAANIWAKGLIYFAHTKAAGMVAGAQKPVIMLSRADEPETKLHSIALGVVISRSQHAA